MLLSHLMVSRSVCGKSCKIPERRLVGYFLRRTPAASDRSASAYSLVNRGHLPLPVLRHDHWQSDDEFTALPIPSLRASTLPPCISTPPLHQRQADAENSLRPFQRAVDLSKHLEDGEQHGGRNADIGILQRIAKFVGQSRQELVFAKVGVP